MNSRSRSLTYITRSANVRPHCIILASCKPGCKPGFRPSLQPGFRQVRAGLRHAFDTLSIFFVENLVANLLHQSRHVEIDAAGSLVRARARQMECRKNQFRASQRTCWSWIFVTYFVIRAHHDVIKWKTQWKSLILHPKTLQIASIMNPRYGTQNAPKTSWNYCTYQLISLAFISGSIVLYASYLCLFLIYCLTHMECFRYFMAANIDFVWKRFEASLQLAFDLVFDQVCSQVFDKFVPVCDTLSTSFELFCRKPGRGSLVRARARQMECRKNRFKQVRSWLSTCFRPACDQVFDQVCSWLE